MRRCILQERLIQLLEAIAGAGKPATVNELIGATGFPKASVYRNIASLIECGFVEEAECGNRYVLGMRFVKIALTGKADTHVINAVSAMMQKTVKELSETAFLARYRGNPLGPAHFLYLSRHGGSPTTCLLLCEGYRCLYSAQHAQGAV